MPKTLNFELGSLSAANTARVVCSIFQVSSIPKALATLIYDRCKGHPRFIYEISELLLTEEKVEVTDGVCRLLQKDLDQLQLPNTIRAVFVSRMDQLSSSEQITLKVASVIGPVFSMQLVCDIYPSGASELQIADDSKFRAQREITLTTRGMRLTRHCSHAPVAALLSARVGQWRLS